MSPVWCRAITWTNTCLLLTGPLRTNSIELESICNNHHTENEFRYVIWKMVVILSRSWCVNGHFWLEIIQSTMKALDMPGAMQIIHYSVTIKATHQGQISHIFQSREHKAHPSPMSTTQVSMHNNHTSTPDMFWRKKEKFIWIFSHFTTLRRLG